MLSNENSEFFADCVREVYQGNPADLNNAIFAVCDSIACSMNEFDNPLEHIHKFSVGWLTRALGDDDIDTMERSGENEAQYRARMYLTCFLTTLGLSYKPTRKD